jgi:large subunit ribosomal protein L5
MNIHMNALKTNSTGYYINAKNLLKLENSSINSFALSDIVKISINIGLGKYKNDSKARQEIENYIIAATGQNPKIIESRLSIAGFKLRKGEPVGLAVTLRGNKMKDFLINLVYLSLPRTRDFKGIKSSSFDSNYNSYSLGIESASIFPLIGFDLSIPFGMQINITFKNKDIQNKRFLELLNFPFVKINK